MCNRNSPYGFQNISLEKVKFIVQLGTCPIFLSPYFDAKLSENKMLETTTKSVHGVPTPQIPSAGDILEKFRKLIKKLPTKSESEKSKCEQCWEH